MTILVNSKAARLLLASLLAALLFNFGNALVFDRVVLILLLLATIISFAINKDTFSILVIACWVHGIEELHWYITEDVLTDVSSVWLKIYCYGLCFFACYLQRYEKITWLVIAVVLVATGFELWWLINDLPGKQIYWYVLVLALATFARCALFWRPHFLHSRFPHIKDWTYSRLDADCDLFLKLIVVVEVAMLSEYLLRYATSNNQIIYFYDSYSYFTHSVNLYLLLSVFLEIKRNYFNRHLHA